MLRWLSDVVGRRSVRIVAVAVMFGALTVAILADRKRLGESLSSLSAADVAVSLCAGAAALVLSAMCWRGLLASAGARLRVPDAAEVFYIGQLGKYLPGSVWTVATQMELGARRGVRRTQTAVATLVQLIVNVVTGVAVFVATLPFQGSRSRHYAFVAVPAGLLALVVLHPQVLSRIVSTGLRVTRRPSLEHDLSARSVIEASAWTVGVWGAYGVHVLALGHGIGGAHTSASAVAGYTGGFALAWTVGFLVVIAPSGAGVREAALVAAFSNRLTGSEALAIALVSRAMLTMLDGVVGLGALGSVVMRRRRSQRATVVQGETR